ncbi:GatB/YqeY domain-containing protein [Acetobacterium paludosum]|uniref:GatB/YqeY domain-containing protein n=1 Tax=Acetobacterium paludosum TaxID=52693 RepID=A0A923HV62_9FIRM|nr:GatB/YqeY domain-containing protein [Acetobacterium paludosum]MBC3889148.1 GatB/YqeY domain-containing protein [Acetobacterium paludosum]
MALKDQLQADLKTAMKEKDKVRKSTITMIRAAILQVEKDEKVELTDEQILEIIAKQLKQRRDSLTEFEKAKRDDLIQQAHEEIKVITSYLPTQLTIDEIRVIVNETIQETGAIDAKDMGKIMGALMPKIKGRADGKLVNQVVRESLI